jgi:hypothetical protein
MSYGTLLSYHEFIILKLQTYGYYLAYFWMNNNSTRNALGIKEVNLYYVFLGSFLESVQLVFLVS